MEQPTKGLTIFKDQQYQPSMAQSNVRSVVSHCSFETLVKQFEEYQPHSTMIEIERLKSSTHLKLKKFKESAYYGQVVNGKRHGQGVMISNNDRIYEGNWENDYKHGPGYEKFPNGSVYQGMYVNGKPEGVGKYSWANGQFYEGEWLNGLKHGSGMWQGAKGDSYVGQWRIGKVDGYGVHVWVNGDRYEGEFKECIKHGQGTERFANGDLYKGQYFKGKPSGYGEYYWVNGSYFKGSFQNGLREGHGMWKKGSGCTDKYQGQYLVDKKSGYGIFSWASGNVYKGHYQQDLRHGFGQMYWSDGSYYKGQWQKGIQHGEGILFLPGQGITKGNFQDNVLVEIFEEQIFPAPQPVTNIPRPGTIHKNYLPMYIIPPLEQPRLNYRSIEVRKKVQSVYQQPQRQAHIHISRQLNPIRQRGEKKVNKNAHTVQIQRVAVNAVNMRQKERIPHSAFYMHKLHKRVSTANNDQKYFVNSKAQSQIVEELRSFTKKMVGRTS